MRGRHGGRGRGGPGGGGRPRRIQRFLEPAVLLALHCTPSHGYGLLEEIRALGLESYPTDISAIYRVLNDLEGAGMLVSSQDSAQSAGPPRRVYALTEAGDQYLRAWVEDLQETVALLHRFIDAYEAHQRTHDAAGDGRSGGRDGSSAGDMQ